MGNVIFFKKIFVLKIDKYIQVRCDCSICRRINKILTVEFRNRCVKLCSFCINIFLYKLGFCLVTLHPQLNISKRYSQHYSYFTRNLLLYYLVTLKHIVILILEIISVYCIQFYFEIYILSHVLFPFRYIKVVLK